MIKHHRCRSHAPAVEVWEGFTGRWFWRICDPANMLGGTADTAPGMGYDDDASATDAAWRALAIAKERRNTRFEVFP